MGAVDVVMLIVMYLVFIACQVIISEAVQVSGVSRLISVTSVKLKVLNCSQRLTH